MNAKTAQLINSERARIQENLGQCAVGHKMRCVTAVARSLLLNGVYHYGGKFLNPKIKSLGVGVYEVWVEED